MFWWGYYSTDLGCFSRDFGEFLDWVECSSWVDVVKAAMRVVSIAGDGLNGVVECALLGTWLDIARNEAVVLEM